MPDVSSQEILNLYKNGPVDDAVAQKTIGMTFGVNKALAQGALGVVSAVWNAESVESAKRLVLEGCMRKGGVNCQVIDINGEPIGPPPAQPGRGTSEAPQKDVWGKYQNGGFNKAYAVGTNGVAGASWNLGSAEGAKNAALTRCIVFGRENCEVIEINGGPVEQAITLPKASDMWNSYQEKPPRKAYAQAENGAAGAGYGASSDEEAIDLPRHN